MRKVAVIGLLIAGLGLGFFIENQKIAINFLLEYGGRFPEFFSLSVAEKMTWVEAWKAERVADYFFAHSTPAWLYTLDYSGLVGVKWILALLAILVFTALNLGIIQLSFSQVKITRYAALFLATLLVLCGGIFVLGKVFHSAGFYAVARELLGGLQSLVPLMILFPAAWLLPRFQQNQPL